MVLSDEKKREYMKKLLFSRMRILCNNGFYGLLLIHMTYSIDESCKSVATNGKRIFFSPDFLENLSEEELDYILMHEILHVVLQHCLRQCERDADLFSIACDIVVNSNILLSNNMDIKKITLHDQGESIHIAPDGKEGYEYTAEQIYSMIISSNKKEETKEHVEKDDSCENSSGQYYSEQKQKDNSYDNADIKDDKEEKRHSDAGETWDDHSRWGMEEDNDTLREVWVKRFEDACESISIRDPSNQRGLLPKFAERLLSELKKPQTNWKEILNDFVQEEIVDYSFTPPDKRFYDCPFFLPDFNEKDDSIEDILFMIDTSGSMSDNMITAAYSEVKGAIDQFGGKLKGWLGFFDAAIIEPQPFSDENEFKIIKPCGGGGTDFQIIFEYVRQHMHSKLPASIIILTDGYAPFPREKMAMGIPVLWLLNNEDVNPSWGKVARIRL